MNDRVFGHLACIYAVTMLVAQIVVTAAGLRAELGDGLMLAMVGLFAATLFSGTLAIGRGHLILGAVGLLGAFSAFVIPGV